jgi:hypothetical protein
MKELLEKILVAEAKVELLKKIIADLDVIPQEAQDKYGLRRKRVNYSKMYIVEVRKLMEARKCIQKRYPPLKEETL